LLFSSSYIVNQSSQNEILDFFITPDGKSVFVSIKADRLIAMFNIDNPQNPTFVASQTYLNGGE